MDTPKPIAYAITRIGRHPETVQADSVEMDGDPRQYLFRKNGNVVLQLFVHALESEPQAVYPQTAESKAAWKRSKQKADAANQLPTLNRG